MQVAKIPHRIFSGFERFWFEPVDARPIALVRIFFAVTALCSLAELRPHRVELLSDQGFIPSLRGFHKSFDSSVFAISETVQGVSLWIIVAALIHISLGFGFFSRTCAFLSLFWHISLVKQLVIADYGLDTVLRCFGLILVITPCGATWSIDAWIRSKRKLGDYCAMIPAYGPRLIKWQLFILYLATAYPKALNPFWQNGEFIGYFWYSWFSLMPSSPVFADYASLFSFMTYAALLIEIIVVVLLWIDSTRWLGFFLGYSLHIGIGLTSIVPVFSLGMMTMYLAFLSPRDLEWLGSLYSRYFRRKKLAEPA